MIGALDADEIERILRSEQIGRLGIYGDDRVHVYPVSFGYDGRDIYIQSREGAKVRLMRAHPEVCFEVEEITSPAVWQTVLAYGRFEELPAAAERDAALALIAAQGREPFAPSLAPYQDGPEHLVVYRIRVDEKHGRFERDEALARSVSARG